MFSKKKPAIEPPAPEEKAQLSPARAAFAANVERISELRKSFAVRAAEPAPAAALAVAESAPRHSSFDEAVADREAKAQEARDREAQAQREDPDAQVRDAYAKARPLQIAIVVEDALELVRRHHIALREALTLEQRILGAIEFLAVEQSRAGIFGNVARVQNAMQAGAMPEPKTLLELRREWQQLFETLPNNPSASLL